MCIRSCPSSSSCYISCSLITCCAPASTTNMSVRSSLHEGIKTFDKLRHLQTLLFFGSTSLLLVRERISFYPIHVSNPVGQYRTDWIFKKTAGGAFHSPPVVGPDGTIYAGSYDGNMYAINPSGVLQWNFSTRGNGIYYSAAVVDSNGNKRCHLSFPVFLKKPVSA